MTTEPVPPAADAGHLTEVLHRVGVLREGRVREVAVESSRATLLSRIVRLRLSYDGGAAGAPGSLILKTGLPGSGVGPESGRREVEFYTKVAAGIAKPAVPRCFEAAFDADTKAWHLLLQDLTDTHAVATKWPLPPTMAQCERIMRVLACCHAAWWDEARLGVSVGTWTDEAAAKQYVQRCADSSRSLPISSAIGCRARSAISTSGSSPPRRGSWRATCRIAISRWCTGTPTCGTASWRSTARTTVSSIGTPGGSPPPRAISPT